MIRGVRETSQIRNLNAMKIGPAVTRMRLNESLFVSLAAQIGTIAQATAAILVPSRVAVSARWSDTIPSTVHSTAS